MAMIDWYIEGPSYGSCNCDWSCPCHFGDVELAGLKAAVFYAWPRAIFEGQGELQVVIDERADEAQRDALLAITSGEHTNEGATHWWVFRAMSDTVHEPLFKTIEFDVDIDARTARVVIADVAESLGSPIRSPATGDEHRVRIDMPNGVEFDLAEIGNASTEARGVIGLNLKDTYGQWNMLRQSGNGVVRK